MGNNNFTSIRKNQSKYSHITSQQNNQQWLQQSQQDSQIDSLWKDVTHQNIYYRLEYGKFQVFRNEVTLQQVEKYKIVLKDKTQFQKWKQLTKWRNNCQFLPKVEYFVVQNMTEICVSQFEVNVFVERIPLRLADLTDIPFPENLYFLLTVSKGLKFLLSHQFGGKMFNITQSMICVNKQGEVKVWMNSNLSQSSPIDVKESNHVTPEQILTTLIDLIQSNTDQRDYPYPFARYLRERNLYNVNNGDFNWIIQQLYSYAREMNVTIPKYAFSVRDVLNKDFLNGTQQEQSENSVVQANNDSKILVLEQPIKDEKLVEKETLYLQEDGQMGRSAFMNFLEKQNIAIKKQQSITFHNHLQDQTFPKDKIHGLLNYNNRDNSENQIPMIPNLRIGESQKIINGRDNNEHLGMRFPMSERRFLNSSVETEKPLIVNKLGNNIIQFRQPQMEITRQPFIENQINHQQHRNQRPSSLSKPINKLQNLSSNEATFRRQPPFMNAPPSVYQMIHPLQAGHSLGYLVNAHQPPSNIYYNLPPVKSTHQFYPSHIQNQDPHNIYRVNSCSIPMKSNHQSPEIVQNCKTSPTYTQPVRPELLSSQVKIERINRQNNQKNYVLNQQNAKKEMKNSASFKNNLVKLQHQEPFKESQLGKLRYFTKKDSQDTLDPQIAVDLMKYLNE